MDPVKLQAFSEEMLLEHLSMVRRLAADYRAAREYSMHWVFRRLITDIVLELNRRELEAKALRDLESRRQGLLFEVPYYAPREWDQEEPTT